ncbi:peptide chain release factor N(5)-glutamine methyltransferase [Patulibacter brassicae]|uniref:Release factor glutamine methyltransferase n=1 Tax=Patulibacter brassicae TaxID=1705717 RepID=A0ABU4VHW8_9ACTN|nr:peptide chain release factor N(5)-glutamine methyltransferase [Patulibacter brassicae]MDX8151417.1 peptide chain release factor N(5)-glutamine methyltransferase [Patulibacter brassicae]
MSGPAPGARRAATDPRPAAPETRLDAVRRLAARFAAAGIDGPRLDAELLVAEVVDPGRPDRTRLFLDGHEPLTPSQAATLAALERRRADERAPVAHLLGTRGFRHVDLVVDGRVLVPRPETELLVEVGLELPSGAAVLDVGTGSGAIALALADERPDLRIHATDVSPDALAVARENARRLDLPVTFHAGDLLAGLDAAAIGTPLAVLSNPPYVPDGDRPSLMPEVRDHDPALALFGGPDGLDVVRRLVPAATDAGAALLAIEIGAGQAPATAALLEAAGWRDVAVRDDLAGIGRVVLGRRP